MTPAEEWRHRLRNGLTAALKDRDDPRIAALRSALNAIDNAETPDDRHIQARGDGAIAGSVAGLGGAEVARRDLSEQEIRRLLRAEIDERHHAAEQISAANHRERADTLRAEAAVLSDLIGDV